ncbi:MAG: xylose isomerase [Chloroflexi bacterium]|nr:xylose isomerase [Chloroflexota bacterium]
MKLSQVAVQLYTLRNFLKTPAEIAQSLHKVREIGYEAVQISGMGPIDEQELVEILDAEGLVCCATHEPGVEILNNPEKVIERLNRLDCQYTAYPFPADVKMDSREDVEVFADALNRAGKVLTEAGKVLTYHNHAIEFRRFGSQTMLEIIFERTDPRYIQAEIDTYWVQAGGANPVKWCSSLQDRLPLLHIKDYAISEENKPTFAEIGYGNLPFHDIVAAADKAGCRWYIVEQDVCPGDPFDSLAKSFEYIKGNLVV